MNSVEATVAGLQGQMIIRSGDESAKPWRFRDNRWEVQDTNNKWWVVSEPPYLAYPSATWEIYVEAFKVEVGKYYKTRDGSKARVELMSAEYNSGYPAIGYIIRLSNLFYHRWSLSGGGSEVDSDYEYDLVAKWGDE